MFTPEDVMEKGTSLMGGGGFMRDMAPVMNHAVQFTEAMRDGARGVNEIVEQEVTGMKDDISELKQTSYDLIDGVIADALESTQKGIEKAKEDISTDVTTQSNNKKSKNKK